MSNVYTSIVIVSYYAECRHSECRGAFKRFDLNGEKENQLNCQDPLIEKSLGT